MHKTRRTKIDPMITMINVVFLLLAFYMFGQFQKPTPTSISLPHAQTGEEIRFQDQIFIHANGEIEPADALNNLQNRKSKPTLLISADANLSANKLIQILSQIQASGAIPARIEVTP